MQERRGRLCSTTGSCLSLAEVRPAVPGSRPEGDGSDVSTEPDCGPPVHDSCGTAYFRHWMPPSGSGASSSSEALGAFDADASSCSLDDPVSAWRKTGDCEGTTLAVAVVDDDTETTTKRRPVQRPLGPQTGATLRAQP